MTSHRARNRGERASRSARPIGRVVTIVTRLGAAGLAVCLGATVALLLPRTDQPGTADAVILLAGADDGRHMHARDLVERGVAPTLLVSNPDGTGEPLARSLCSGTDRPGGVEVVCFVPRPRTTWGEAAAVDAIARARGWRSIVVVTNRPHTLRARTWFRRRTDLTVRMSPIDRVDLPRLPVHVAWEIAGFAKGAVIARR